jgi:hypothetical protein
MTANNRKLDADLDAPGDGSSTDLTPRYPNRWYTQRRRSKPQDFREQVQAVLQSFTPTGAKHGGFPSYGKRYTPTRKA